MACNAVASRPAQRNGSTRRHPRADKVFTAVRYCPSDQRSRVLARSDSAASYTATFALVQTRSASPPSSGVCARYPLRASGTRPRTGEPGPQPLLRPTSDHRAQLDGRARARGVESRPCAVVLVAPEHHHRAIVEWQRERIDVALSSGSLITTAPCCSSTDNVRDRAPPDCHSARTSSAICSSLSRSASRLTRSFGIETDGSDEPAATAMLCATCASARALRRWVTEVRRSDRKKPSCVSVTDR